jgi:hypothetical protein
MGAYGSPEFVPAPEPQYEKHYCKHCQCNVYGNYCPICGRALSKRAKWKLFWTVIVSVIVIDFVFLFLVGYFSVHN